MAPRSLKRRSTTISLRDQFLTFNVLYFGGQLPTDTIVIWSRKLRPTVCGEYDGDDTIAINATLRNFRPCWKSTLLHEMAHLATHEEAAEHGPKWKREMARLMKLGAFDDLL